MQCTTLLIDLDETLYPSSTGVWDAIAERMNQYLCLRYGIAREDVAMEREKLYRTYGTTLRGLQETRGVDVDEYLAYVHDIPLHTLLTPDPHLREVLQSYPQRKLVFTNADRPHAQRVLRTLALEDCVDGVIDVHDVAPFCKPMLEAFQIALKICGETDPGRCVFLDDSARNLHGAHLAGIHTILVGHGGSNTGASAGGLASSASIDRHILRLNDLPQVLSPEGALLPQNHQRRDAA